MATERVRDRTDRADPILEVRNLRTVFYTDRETIRATDGVSADIYPGETLGVVGESGSGKSVTARSIMRLVDSPGQILKGSSIRYRQTETVREYADSFSGRTANLSDAAREIEMDAAFDQIDRVPQEFGYEQPADVPIEDLVGGGYGPELGLCDEGDFVFVTEGETTQPGQIQEGFVEITALEGEARRLMRGGRIAMIFQDPLSSLNPVFTIGNQIKEALSLHRDMQGAEATREAAELLEAVGIPDSRRRLKEYPHQFSGGMRQRAVIAMALACDPDVLICDEPTTALDVTIEAQILDLFAQLQAERDLAILFITHDMGVIANVADRVNVMYAGEMVEKADVDQLFDHPKHPYTQGLLESIPGAQSGDSLSTIDGSVPTPNEPPTACRFADRCPKAFEACRQVHPVQVPANEQDDDHMAACLLYPEEMSEREAAMMHDQRNPLRDEESDTS
ncbi:MAG: oligopeptide/dipeptide ABC transporter, ATP-binding protein, C-terminal domain protein [halophilic archaeon J07HX64]|jgi:oligopeptide/dipeptide ABC transporter, ATP-binding protein, C-terminal domain|nr:MAG: oligopeptide/dipeptide ABC transporter, ATP-binding protein, C-terminal domain protein [halophilic archaeon J07HX64]